MLPALMTAMRSQISISFAQIARDDDEALALARLFGQHLINIKLGADIDAAGGSSNSITGQSRYSQRAITTFCWLPPDSSATVCALLRERMPRR